MQIGRLEAIQHHLYVHGVSSIPDLADAVGASLATVRRDLQVLEQQGVVSRGHGNARIARGAETEAAFAIREKRNLAAKRAIAQAAYDRLVPRSSVFLDAGTTVLQLVHRLRIDPMPLTVFTNGLVVAQELMTVPELTISVIGGQIRIDNASLSGPAAEASLDALWFNQLFLGAGAIGDDNRIYSVDPGEASLNALMQRRAAETVLLADSSKFGRRATHLVSPLAAPMSVITDDGLSAEAQARLRETGTALTVVVAAGGAPAQLPRGKAA